MNRSENVTGALWQQGCGPIQHTPETCRHIEELHLGLEAEEVARGGVPFYDLLHAADRMTCMGMWLVVHQTYAARVYLDGRPLEAGDFKVQPEGHTGGSLNMVPAYVGYLLANAISGHTRGWLMGQGHCVSAIDSVNLLQGNMSPQHAARYDVSDAGLSRFVGDFYGYRIGANGEPAAPLGSHVNAFTAGGLAEGGYLGFAELQYIHMPLPGERLVVFLSDGAFEEQRGSDWAPRWWRAEDSGWATPIMIANGRRIDQRTTVTQQGGVGWFVRHLRLNGFDPLVFDGHDPAAFAWAILEMERRLAERSAAVKAGRMHYPIPLPYGIAVSRKGAGFYGAGTNLAHNLPLGTNPHTDPVAAAHFNESTRRLWVPLADLTAARDQLNTHAVDGRPLERDHPLAMRDVRLTVEPKPDYRPVALDRLDPSAWPRVSPMAAVDGGFLAAVQANPHLRPRVGNPDEMKSNRLLRTLEALHFRVTAPEPGIPESLSGAVITALNEEAIAAAALANKGGINLIATYEAFGMKMHGAVRQEVIWADEMNAAGRENGWLSVPLVLTSHAWENGKNERSHQDPSMAEALLGEPADVSRVLFVPDFNTAAAVMAAVFRTRGQIWTLVVPKADSVPNLLTAEEAERLVAEGGLDLAWAGHRASAAGLILTAVGGYQLGQVVQASIRLAERDVPHRVVVLLEPGRFGEGRGPREAAHCVAEATRDRLYPADMPSRIFLSHTRPGPLLGRMAPLCTGSRTIGLGFQNQGGTLNTNGMLFVNRCSWAHVVDAAAGLMALPRGAVLTAEEQAALDGHRAPAGTIY